MYVKHSYPILHWVITVLVGPFFLEVYMLASSDSGYDDFGTLWPVAVLFGAVMSLPVLCLYLLVFRLVRDASISEPLLKCMMDILVVGITGVALALLGGTMVPRLFASYALAIVFGSVILRFRRSEKPILPQP